MKISGVVAVPSFQDRNRAKRVDPTKASRQQNNERSTLIDRVLQALEVNPTPQETAAQTAARIAEPEVPPTRANLIDRVLARLRGDDAPAQTIAAGFKAVAENDQTVIGRTASATAKIIEGSKEVSDAIERAVSGETQPPQRTELENAVDQLRSNYRDKLRGIAEQLQAGDITHANFRYMMGKEVKKLLTQAAVLGAGGQANMTDTQRKLLDRSVRDQLAYLDGFHRDIRELINQGKPIPNRMIGRAGSYASAAMITANQARRQSMADEVAQDDADLWEVRVLGAAEHCVDCVRYANRPAPIGTLPPIGDSQCGSNCKCQFEYGSREDLERKYGKGSS